MTMDEPDEISQQFETAIREGASEALRTLAQHHADSDVERVEFIVSLQRLLDDAGDDSDPDRSEPLTDDGGAVTDGAGGAYGKARYGVGPYGEGETSDDAPGGDS